MTSRESSPMPVPPPSARPAADPAQSVSTQPPESLGAPLRPEPHADPHPPPQPLDVFTCDLDASSVVEASAGTGKTWNICGLVLRLLIEREVPVSGILVMTFTTAATAELRDRIRQRLVETLAYLSNEAKPSADPFVERPVETPAHLSDAPKPSADPFVERLLAALRNRGVQDAVVRSRVETALAEFDEASIYTIHSFCQRAATDHAFAAQLPFESEVLADAAEIRLAVAEDFWRREVIGETSDGETPSSVSTHDEAVLREARGWRIAMLLRQKDSPATYAEVLASHLKLPLALTRWPASISPGSGAAASDAQFETSMRTLNEAYAAAARVWLAKAPEIVESLRDVLGKGVLHAGAYKEATIRKAESAWAQWLEADHPLHPASDNKDGAKSRLLYTQAKILSSVNSGWLKRQAASDRTTAKSGKGRKSAGKTSAAASADVAARALPSEVAAANAAAGPVDTPTAASRPVAASVAAARTTGETLNTASAPASGAVPGGTGSPAVPRGVPDHPFFALAEALVKAREAVTQAFAVWRVSLLHRLVTEGPARVRRETERRRQLSYDDMLVNLYRRLVPEGNDPAACEQAAALARALRARYPAVLIDEFQDTDPVQYGIFRAIYGDAGTRFMVGDPKQAIYGFRGADLPTYLQAKADARRIYTLAHNQRSSPALLQALNALFGAQARGRADAGQRAVEDAGQDVGHRAGQSAGPDAEHGAEQSAGQGGCAGESGGQGAVEDAGGGENSPAAASLPGAAAEPGVFMVPGIDYVPVTAGERVRAIFRDPGGPLREAAPATEYAGIARAAACVEAVAPEGADPYGTTSRHAPAADAVPAPPTEPDPVPLVLWELPDTDDGGTPLRAGPLRERAAEATAGEIARLLGAGGPGSAPATLDDRPLRAGEIAVLVRSHTDARIMREALARRRVRSVLRMREDVFHSVQALELLQVMTAVNEPGRAGCVRAALATSLLGWDAARLLTLQDDERAWTEQIESLLALGRLWQQRGVGVMLRRWMRDRQVSTRLLAQQDGERALTNLLHLAEALHAAERHHATPESLLRWMQAQCRRRGEEVEEQLLRLESDENLVQIVTVHSAKGLEYAVVFCPFLWTADGRAPTRPRGWLADRYHDPEAKVTVLDYRRLLSDAVEGSASDEGVADTADGSSDSPTDDAGRSRAAMASMVAPSTSATSTESASNDAPSARMSSPSALSTGASVLSMPTAGAEALSSGAASGLSGAYDAKAIARVCRQAAAAEELRLIYVALTRAKHRCVLVVGGKRLRAAAAPNARRRNDAAAEREPDRAPALRSKTLLDWIVAGTGRRPDQWLEDGAPLDQVKAGWTAMLQAAGGTAKMECLPTFSAAPSVQSSADSRPAQVQPLPSVLPQPWRIGSYSGLVHGAGDEHGGEDHDLRAPAPVGSALRGRAERSEADGLGLPPPEDDPVWLVGGREVGTAVHVMFEQIEFTDPSTWPAGVEAALARLPEPRVRAGGAPDTLALRRARLARLLENTLATPLPLDEGAPLELRALAARARRVEMEFHLPVGTSDRSERLDAAGRARGVNIAGSADDSNAPWHAEDLDDEGRDPQRNDRSGRSRGLESSRQAESADPAQTRSDGLACDRLSAFLQRHGYGSPPLSFPRLRGYLKGFIDLVFEHAGRYYVLDWKTNWLGSDPRRYGPLAVQAEMTRHGYHLQHLLYTVALHRLLAQRLTGYDPHRHLGGAVYLFVRAVRPGLVIDGVPAGVHIHRTPVDVVRELSDLLDGMGARDD